DAGPGLPHPSPWFLIAACLLFKVTCSARARTPTALAALSPATTAPTHTLLHTEPLQPFAVGKASTHGDTHAHMPAPNPSAKMRMSVRARLSSVFTADPSSSA